MFGNHIKRIICFMSVFVFFIVIVGCDNSQPMIESNSDIQFEKASTYDINSFSSFQTVSSDELLEGSIELPYYEGYGFTPTRFTNNGWILGHLQNLEDDTDKYFAYFDVNTNEYQKVMQLEISEFSSVGFEAISDDYIVFRESISANINTNRFYVYNIAEQTYEQMIEIKDIPIMLTHFYIVKDKVYFGLPSENENYAIYEYDILNKNLTILVDTNESEKDKINHFSPILIEDTMYYIKNNMGASTSELIKMNMDTKEKESIYKLYFSENNEQFGSLKSDGKDIFVYVEEYPTVICYKFDIVGKKITPFFKETGLENPIIFAGYMKWSEVSKDTEKRIHPQSYLFDYVNEINYEFLDSLIMQSEKGIVWTKYKIDEKQIYKGELYNNENTVMMYKAY